MSEPERLDELIERLALESGNRTSRRLWAAMMLARDVSVAEAICEGRPVLVRRLDRLALARAMRGRALPEPHVWLHVEADMLDAIAEGGPFARGEVE